MARAKCRASHDMRQLDIARWEDLAFDKAEEIDCGRYDEGDE